jgi:hypothetical protein
MQLPEILQGESRTRLIQGMALGAVATMIVGFNWGGWVFGSTARSLSADAVSAALVAKLAPICVERFKAAPDAATQLVELKKTNAWQQDDFITKGKWSIMAGSERGENGVAKACADMLVKT